MVMLARKRLNAYVSCCPIEANGLSNVILKMYLLSWTYLFKPRSLMLPTWWWNIMFYLEKKPVVPPDFFFFLLSIVFLVADKSGSSEMILLANFPMFILLGNQQYHIWAYYPEHDVRKMAAVCLSLMRFVIMYAFQNSKNRLDVDHKNIFHMLMHQ